MLNRLQLTLTGFVALWLFSFIVASLTFGPWLITKYAPPTTDFKLGPVGYDSAGAAYFKPTFTKRWCVYQTNSASWHTVTNGVSERVALTIAAPPGNQNRPAGRQQSVLWKVDIFATPNATSQFGQLTHKCLFFMTVETKVGPWPVPLEG